MANKHKSRQVAAGEPRAKTKVCIIIIRESVKISPHFVWAFCDGQNSVLCKSGSSVGVEWGSNSTLYNVIFVPHLVFIPEWPEPSGGRYQGREEEVLRLLLSLQAQFWTHARILASDLRKMQEKERYWVMWCTHFISSLWPIFSNWGYAENVRAVCYGQNHFAFFRC